MDCHVTVEFIPQITCTDRDSSECRDDDDNRNNNDCKSSDNLKGVLCMRGKERKIICYEDNNREKKKMKHHDNDDNQQTTQVHNDNRPACDIFRLPNEIIVIISNYINGSKEETLINEVSENDLKYLSLLRLTCPRKPFNVMSIPFRLSCKYAKTVVPKTSIKHLWRDLILYKTLKSTEPYPTESFLKWVMMNSTCALQIAMNFKSIHIKTINLLYDFLIRKNYTALIPLAMTKGYEYTCSNIIADMITKGFECSERHVISKNFVCIHKKPTHTNNAYKNRINLYPIQSDDDTLQLFFSSLESMRFENHIYNYLYKDFHDYLCNHDISVDLVCHGKLNTLRWLIRNQYPYNLERCRETILKVSTHLNDNDFNPNNSLFSYPPITFDNITHFGNITYNNHFYNIFKYICRSLKDNDIPKKFFTKKKLGKINERINCMKKNYIRSIKDYQKNTHDLLTILSKMIDENIHQSYILQYMTGDNNNREDDRDGNNKSNCSENNDNDFEKKISEISRNRQSYFKCLWSCIQSEYDNLNNVKKLLDEEIKLVEKMNLQDLKCYRISDEYYDTLSDIRNKIDKLRKMLY